MTDRFRNVDRSKSKGVGSIADRFARRDGDDRRELAHRTGAGFVIAGDLDERGLKQELRPLRSFVAVSFVRPVWLA